MCEAPFSIFHESGEVQSGRFAQHNTRISRLGTTATRTARPHTEPTQLSARGEDDICCSSLGIVAQAEADKPSGAPDEKERVAPFSGLRRPAAS